MHLNGVFHGTNCVFREFECPAYFSESYDTAKFFAENTKGDSFVMRCNLSFEHPYEVSISGQSWGGFILPDEQMQRDCFEYCAGGDEEELQYWQEEGLTVNALAEFLNTLGYDGVIVHDCYEEDGSFGTQYVALKSGVAVIESVTRI